MSLSPSTQMTFSCNVGAVCDLPGNLNGVNILVGVTGKG